MPRPPAKRFRERQRNAPSTSGRVAKPTERRNTRDKQVADDSDGFVTAVEGRSNRKDLYMSRALGGNVDDGEADNARSTIGNNESRNSESQRTPTSKLQGNSGLQLDTTRSRAYSANFSALAKRGEASSRGHRTGTPAFESSMLSNFRRRPRQPSILQMMQVELDSEGDDEDFLGSLEPEDESTPFKVAKRTRISQELMATPLSMRQAQLSEMSRQIAALGEVLPGPEPAVHADDGSSTIHAPDDGANMSEDEESLPPQRRIGRSEPPEILSQTMLPPMSSSVIASPDKDQPPPAHQDKMIKLKSSRASGKLKKGTSSVPARPEHISTEALRENLLPHRRRRRERDEFDIEDEEPSAHEADDDELSFMRPRRGRPRALAEANDRINKKSKLSKKGEKRKQKGNEKSGGISKSSRARESRHTYSTRRGRDVTPDAENLPRASDDTASDPVLSTPIEDRRFLSEELRERAKYFAEIGRWQLEFEDVIISSSQSPSPLR